MKRKLGALDKIEADLTSLQYKVRRDPGSYFEDFQQQYLQYQTQRDLLLQNPSTSDDTGIVRLNDLIDFTAHCAEVKLPAEMLVSSLTLCRQIQCYPKTTAQFPTDLIQILTLHHDEMQTDLRDKMVGSLVLLRNKVGTPYMRLSF